MAGSDSGGSHTSVQSNASSYSGHRVVTGTDGQPRVQSAPVPDDAPELPEGAVGGDFDVEAQTFHALDTKQRLWQAVKDEAMGAWRWTMHHKLPLTKGGVDITPSGLQALASSMEEARAKLGAQASATVLQAAVAARDLVPEFAKFCRGEPVDRVYVAAGLARIAAGATSAAAILGPNSPHANRLNVAGAWVAGAATMMDATREVIKNPVRQQGQGQNVELANSPAQAPPGSPVQGSSRSFHAAAARPTSAGSGTVNQRTANPAVPVPGQRHSPSRSSQGGRSA